MTSLSPARRRLLILLAVASLAGYLALASYLNAEALLGGLRSLGWTGVAAVLGLSLFNYLLRFWRWHGYVAAFGHDVPLGRHWLYYLGGFAFTVSPGKAGEAVRSLYLKRHGVSYPHSLAALFAERVLDVLAICLLAVVCAGAFAGYQAAALAFGAVIFAVAWFLGRPSLVDWLRTRSEAATGAKRNTLRGTASTLEGARQLLLPRRLYPALLLGVIAWGAEGYALYLLAAAYEVPISIEAGVAIYALGVLGGALSFFMPGGLGGMEAVMTGLIVAVGKASLAVAAAITLLCRFATLWFAVALGLVALTLLELLELRRSPTAALAKD